MGLLSGQVAFTDQFTFTYLDDSGEGFFSEEPREPIGGNPGKTLGEQRRFVVEEAARIWSLFLEVNGPIEIESSFGSFECTAFSGVLAGASAQEMAMNFPEAPLEDTWYVGALANHLAGRDLFLGSAEIGVTVNSAIDSDPGCLGGDGFYYGFDGEEGFQIDFLRTMLHELGHGLGFSSLVFGQSGFLPAGIPDSYTRNLFDLLQGTTWDQLTNGQRSASSTSEMVVWAGRNTQLGSASEVIFGPQVPPVVEVIEGGQVVTSFMGAAASFGDSLPVSGLTGELAVIDDGVVPVTDACEDLPEENASDLAGKIVLIDRGTCFFTEKILRAEAAGALAVIMANNVGDGLLVMGGSAPLPSIPSIFVGQTSGEILREFPPGTQFTLSGTNETGTVEGRPFMHTPSTFEPGSSISHFSSGLFPNLLMEPFIGENRFDPDLAITVMRDIGWDVRDVPFPNLDYELWESLNVTGTLGREEDSDEDGVSNFEEYAFGSDPEDRDSVPEPLMIDASADPVIVSYSRTDQAVDLDFQIRESTDLTDFSTEVVGSLLTSDAGPERERDEVEVGPVKDGQRFFRLEVLEQ